jgi:hypothetical protein
MPGRCSYLAGNGFARRHLSFVEGRSPPSLKMLLTLAERLDVPRPRRQGRREPDLLDHAEFERKLGISLQ